MELKESSSEFKKTSSFYQKANFAEPIKPAEKIYYQ
jgi:hypothetical protein